MFKNYRIGAKLAIGFGVLLSFIIIVGLISLLSINSITYQLEIAKKANTALTDAQDTQAGSLRYIIYNQEKYHKIIETEEQKVLSTLEETKKLMKSDSNKAKADSAIEAMNKYLAANDSYYEIEQKKKATGKLRAAAAGTVLSGIKTLLNDVVYKRGAAYGDRIPSAYYKSTMAAQEVRNGFNRVRVWAQKYQIAVDPKQQDSIAKNWMAELASVEKQVTVVAGMLRGSAAKDATSKILSGITNYRARVMDFRKLNLEQRKVMISQREGSQEVMTIARDVRDGVYEHIDSVEISAVVYVLIGLVVAIVVSIFAGFIITRGITEPMTIVTKSVRKLSEFTTAIASEMKDKLAKGDWSNNINIDLNDENLRKVKELSELPNEIGEVCSAEDSIAEAINATQEAVNDVVNQVNEALQQVNATVVQVSAGAQQVADASQGMSQGATEQAASIEEITSSITEIGSQAEQNSTNASEAQRLANSAKDSVVNGNHQMKEMVTSMNTISESSQNISKIIKAIDEIAFQTNLLALNAAVEAARAGKHGKGFAVVAEEVRNLAARSATAAKETTDMIEDSNQKVEAGVLLAEKTAKALSEILESVNSTAELVGNIAEASNVQSGGVKQVNEAMAQVDVVTQSNAANAEETAASSEEMSSQSIELQRLVNRFKLKESEAAKSNVVPIKQPPAEETPKVDLATAKPNINLIPEEGQWAQSANDFGKY